MFLRSSFPHLQHDSGGELECKLKHSCFKLSLCLMFLLFSRKLCDMITMIVGYEIAHTYEISDVRH